MVYNPDTGKREAVVDGMWLLTFAVNGLAGLVTLTVAVLLPTVLLRKRVPPAWWGHPFAAPATACAVLLTLHMADNLLNAMINPIFICAIGGMVAFGRAGDAAPAARLPRAARPGGERVRQCGRQRQRRRPPAHGRRRRAPPRHGHGGRRRGAAGAGLQPLVAAAACR
jgi:hypothetical protein